MLLALLASSFLTALPSDGLYRPANLVAWCVVPFDAQKRSPEDRAEMLARLGFRQFAYDWRAEHVPTFERELIALKKHNIQLTALWFPGGLTKENRQFLDLLDKHKIRTQLWLMLTDFPATEQTGKVAQAVAFVRPVAEEAARRGHQLALYNHGGWGGEPENLIRVIESLNLHNVGIVYNLHHGHDQLDRFPKLLDLMKPHLFCLNLNGMVPRGDRQGQKILPLGHGSEDDKLFKIIASSGYTGPIGILGHTDDDAAERLQDNLDGLAWRLNPKSVRPAPRTPTGMPYHLRPMSHRQGFELEALLPSAQSRLAQTPEADWARLLQVFRVDASFHEAKLDQHQPLLGTWSRTGNTLKFQANYPFQEGQTYRAYVNTAMLDAHSAGRVSRSVTIPPIKREPSAKVEQVYPSADVLPENTLRLYIEFSAPMSRGGVYQHLQLLDDKNQPVKYPFLELDEELWSPDSTRFTLLFDPGRVKRGLVPRAELGPPLEEGKSYILRINSAWKDEHGTSLVKPFEKRFRVGPPVESGLDLKKHFQPGASPAAGQQTPYTIKFHQRQLDAALAQRLIGIETANGDPLPGSVSLTKYEAAWEFRPAEPWKPGEYRLKIDTRLEDVCGNRLGEPFEVDVFKPVQQKIEAKTVGWSFVVK